MKELEKRKRPAEEVGSRALIGQLDLAGDGPGKLICLARRRQAVEQAQEIFQVSERRVCRTMEQPRPTQRYQGKEADNEEMLTVRIVTLASQYGRCGYRRITAMLQMKGWRVNHKCVERIWRQEGLKVPKKRPKRGRLWLNDSSCLRLRPEYPDHVWRHDFVLERTHDGRAFRILNVIDEYTHDSYTCFYTII